MLVLGLTNTARTSGLACGAAFVVGKLADGWRCAVRAASFRIAFTFALLGKPELAQVLKWKKCCVRYGYITLKYLAISGLCS